jgi:hypothetical protein
MYYKVYEICVELKYYGISLLNPSPVLFVEKRNLFVR